MGKKKYIILLICYIIYLIGFFIYYINSKDVNIKGIYFVDDKKYLYFIDNNSEKNKIKTNIYSYLKKNKYEDFKKITFKYKFNKNGVWYFYFYIDDTYKDLFECEYKNSKLNINYLGNSFIYKKKSSKTGNSYLKIMNPKEYKKQMELEELIKNAKNTPPDEFDGAHMEPEYGETLR